MTNAQRIANKEVLIILNKLNLINQIPKNIILNMQNNQDENWNFIYNDNLPLDKQKLNRKSIIMISALYYKYICKDSNEREKIKMILQENEKKAIAQTEEKLNNLNKKTFETSSNVEANEQAKNELIETKKVNFIQKFINSIKKFFKK